MKIIRRIIGKSLHIIHFNMAKLFSTKGKVLMIHWVGDEIQDKQTEAYRISVQECHELVNWLKNKNTIPLIEWENKDNFFALTIDDVPENFYYNAYPILIEAKIPFTLFVNVSLLDKKGFISKQQLIEMSQSEFCTIGSHGINHGEFTQLNKKQALQDLKESKKKLESIIGQPVEMFAYPYGSYYACGYLNKHLACLVYKYAFGTVPCPITKPSLLKKYYLPRINVNTKFIKKLRYA